MVLEPTSLSLSGERFCATYELTGPVSEARARADALRVEQTIEFPADLVPDDDIQQHVIGRIESFDEVGPDRVRVVVSYAVETVGGELPQLLNVLFGNSSILAGIRLVDLELSASILGQFDGPRFGTAGVREYFGADGRPLLATALKPMGFSSERLADQAYMLALGGLDIIKDDHSLANQAFADFRSRVSACSQAVRRANAETGGRAAYMPSLNAPYDELDARLDVVLEAGAGAVLVLPGLTGFDHLRYVAGVAGVPVMGHPAFLGSYTVSRNSGIAHGVLYGTLMRLAGADMSIYPNYGGRFSFTEEECRSIADRLATVTPGIAPALPTPGGGMRVDRVAEIVEFYGADVVLLIGGDLHRGDDLVARARAFRSAVDQ
jgi:ribulose-bisphosphate carboxylase large chain